MIDRKHRAQLRGAVYRRDGADGYRDMERFIGTRTEPDWADRLSIAIQGRGAFRRFKDVLSRRPEELDEWFPFSEEHQHGRARAWLADAGYRVAPRPGGADER